MIVECPGCTTIFPVDPQKVPTAGIHARCSVCSEVFFVEVPEPEVEPVAAETPEASEEEVYEETEVEIEEEGEIDSEEDAEALEAFEEPPPEDFGGQVPTETVEEEEPAIVEAEPTFGEAETTFEEAEPTFGEAETAFEEAETPFGEAVETSADVEEALGEVDGAFEETPDEVVEAIEDELEGPSLSGPLFGKRDPTEKAQRLARVLVSDIILYNPDRHHSATETGRVKEEFEEEIQKSWNEYVEQVGEEIANSTNFFNDALNEILAKGEQVF